MKYVKIFSIPLIIFTFLLFCSDNGIAPDRKNYIIPGSDISYYEHLQPMFEGKCGWGTGCHNDTYDGGINFLYFTNKEQFMEREIIPGSPETKLVGEDLLYSEYMRYPERTPLYRILTETYITYERQPPPSYGRAPLNENQLNGILQWIREGAPD